MINVQIKKSSPEESFIPIKNSNGEAGYDLFTIESYSLSPLERKCFKTGISVAMPIGIYGRVAPRSGLALKKGIDVMAGVIDPTYRGEIGVVLINLSDTNAEIKKGDRIAQIIFENYNNVAFIESESLPESSREENGFGSSGR